MWLLLTFCLRIMMGQLVTFVFTFLLAPRNDCSGFLRKSPSKLYIIKVLINNFTENFNSILFFSRNFVFVFAFSATSYWFSDNRSHEYTSSFHWSGDTAIDQSKWICYNSVACWFRIFMRPHKDCMHCWKPVRTLNIAYVISVLFFFSAV